MIEKNHHNLNVGLTQKDVPDYLFHYVFFLISLIFLIFDVEIALLLPITIYYKYI
ncbi:NADH-ubiquinone oxidoreductase chain 3 [Blattella germanica]|nr:NADH-ubiquinone oxidoreductase chain 3 [Blattella germanica]